MGYYRLGLIKLNLWSRLQNIRFAGTPSSADLGETCTNENKCI